MVLGLIRILVLDIWGIIEAYRKAGDKTIPWKLTFIRTLEWVFPIKRLGHERPIYSALAILFHIGLIVTPLFLLAHIRLWDAALNISWISLNDNWADWLAILTIVTGLAIFIGRAGKRESRAISRKQDYLWPLVLIVPSITGYICANVGVSAGAYRAFMLIHILSAETIFVLLPFTKIAHCILQPLSQLVIVMAWKFPARVDEDICETLDKKGAKV